MGQLTSPTVEIIEPPLDTLTPVEVIQRYSKLYGTDPVLIEKVMLCESSGNPNAVNRNEPNKVLSVGIMQFQEPSFNYLEKQMGEDLDFYSAHDQIKLATWSIANGKGNNWSCYKKLR